MDDDLDEAIRAAELQLAGTERPHVAVVLEYMGEVLQAKSPSEMALRGMIDALQDIPPDLLRLSAQRLLRRHTYRTLPLPGEFYEAVADELSERRGLLRWLQGRQRMLALTSGRHTPTRSVEAPRRGGVARLGEVTPRPPE